MLMCLGEGTKIDMRKRIVAGLLPVFLLPMGCSSKAANNENFQDRPAGLLREEATACVLAGDPACRAQYRREDGASIDDPNGSAAAATYKPMPRMPRGQEEAARGTPRSIPEPAAFSCLLATFSSVHWAGVRMADFLERYPPELIDGKEPKYVYM